MIKKTKKKWHAIIIPGKLEIHYYICDAGITHVSDINLCFSQLRKMLALDLNFSFNRKITIMS